MKPMKLKKRVKQLTGKIPKNSVVKAVTGAALWKMLNKKQSHSRNLLKEASQRQLEELIGLKKDFTKYISTIDLNYNIPKKGFPWLKVGIGTVSSAALAYSGLALLNKRNWSNISLLENHLPGEPFQFQSGLGITYYIKAGTHNETTPVVLIHGIGAGASSYEWLQNFGELANHHPVYAYDLMGFGNSEKPDLKYTADTYIQQLIQFLQNVVGKPAILVASSLSTSHAVQVAKNQPDLVERLVLVEPTGISFKKKVQILPGFTYQFLRSKVVGKSIYSLITTHASIRAFMENELFYDHSQVTDEMVQQYYIASHQPGSEFAPPSFLTGLLNADIGETITQLKQPVLLVCGGMSNITPVEEVIFLKNQNPGVRLEIITEARMMPQWEHSSHFNRVILDFMNLDSPVVSAFQPRVVATR